MDRHEIAPDQDERIDRSGALTDAIRAEEIAIERAHQVLDEPTPHAADREREARADLRAAYNEHELGPSLESTQPIAHVGHRQEVLSTDQDLTDTVTFAPQHEAPTEPQRRGRFHKLKRFLVSTGRHVSRSPRTEPVDPEYAGRHRSKPQEEQTVPQPERVQSRIHEPVSSTTESLPLPSSRDYYHNLLELAESPFRAPERTPELLELIDRIKEWGKSVPEGNSIDPTLTGVDEKKLRINLYDAVSAAANRLGTTLSSSQARDPALLFTGELADQTSSATVTEIGRLLGVDLSAERVPQSGSKELATKITNTQARYIWHSSPEGESSGRISIYLVRLNERTSANAS